MTLPIEPLPLSMKATMRSTRFSSESIFCSVLWLERTTSSISGWSRAASVSPSAAGRPFAVELSTSTYVSPRIPAVLNNVTESLRRLKEYLVLTFIVTSTGVIGLPPTIRTPVTLPMSTPAKRTGAPSRRPPALSKYDRRVILWVNHPPVPLMTKIRTASVTLANRTVSPTRSCDHLSCFWLGKVVSQTTEHNSKHHGISGSRFLEAGKGLSGGKNEGSHSFRVGREEWEPFLRRRSSLRGSYAKDRRVSDAPRGPLLTVSPLFSEPASPACWAWGCPGSLFRGSWDVPLGR